MRTEIKISALMAAAAFVFLALQVFPAVHAGDSGELIASAGILGNAHPPGYPLFSLLGKMFLAVTSGNPAGRMNLLQSFYACICAGIVSLMVSWFIFSGEGTYAKAAAVFGPLFLFSGRPFIEQATVAEVFMLNLLIILIILLAVSGGKYSLAGLAAGVGLGNQHTLVLVFPVVACFMLFERRPDKVWNFLLWMAVGLSVYLYLPIRAAVSPGINWGNPGSIRGMLRVITRQDYGTFSLHHSATGFSLSKALSILSYFFLSMMRTATLPGFALFLSGTYLICRRNLKQGAGIIILFVLSGPVFFLMTNMEIDSAGESILDRFFLLPYAAAVLGSTGIFLARKKIVYAAYAIPLYLMAANFAPGSSKPAVLYDYIKDIEDTLRPGDSLYIARGGVGDDIVFGMAYLKWAEGSLKETQIYSEYGSIFPGPSLLKGRTAFATFSPEKIPSRLYQSGLLYKNYPDPFPFEKYRGYRAKGGLDYRQRNIAVNYPFFMGKYLFGMGRYEEGEKEFDRALSIGSDIPWLLNNIGNVYGDLEDSEKAYRFYSLALEKDPRMGEAYNNIANIYFERKEFEKAVEYYSKAIAVEPDEVRYYNLALTYSAMKNKDKAEANFIKAIKINPGYVNAYNDLGLLYYRGGETEKATGILKKGAAIDPDNQNIIFNLGLCLERAGSPDARKYWKRFLDISPADDPDRSAAQRYLSR
ncbi:MAG: tetratricopeptide repeat protein [Elusimicrobia bacterium]|nr:tetratricopeptide repeat protein [Elusimicrobiota bacterium]